MLLLDHLMTKLMVMSDGEFWTYDSEREYKFDLFKNQKWMNQANTFDNETIHPNIVSNGYGIFLVRCQERKPQTSSLFRPLGNGVKH